MRTWAFALLLATALLAGCAGKGGADDGDKLQLADGTTIDLGEGTSDTTGAIAGYVVDEAIRPIGGVTLRTTDGAASATSDDNGFFLMGDLAPGTYIVQATATGFADVQAAAVDVVAGETATVKVQMAHVTVPVAYHDVFPFEGYMQAWGTIGQWAVEIVAPTSLCQCTYALTPSGNVTAIVLEAFWEATIPDPAGLGEFYWEMYDVDSDASWIQSGYCTNPCRAEVPVVSEDALTGEQVPFPQGATFEVRLSGPDAWVEYQQQVKVFTTLFYNGDDPTGFTIAEPA